MSLMRNKEMRSERVQGARALEPLGHSIDFSFYSEQDRCPQQLVLLQQKVIE